MMGNTVRIGRVVGIELRLDASWFLIFGLVTWSLAGHYFPMLHPGWPPAGYWVMGAVTAVLFFASVVTHELAHSLVSRANGTPVQDITLFIFGGAARIAKEPQRAQDELLMAAAGPVTSLALASGFWLLWQASADFAAPLHALAGWLAGINFAVGLFNLLPGFPLDGGRIVRAVIWAATGNLQQATSVAALLGRIVAFGLIFWGAGQIFAGAWANGLWIAFIGWFLDNAAVQSVREEAVRQLLAGHTAREVMMTDWT